MRKNQAGYMDSFLWGVATSAFQMEGSVQADWMEWDRFLRLDHRITNHWDLFRKDLALLEELGVNAYRFSIEWSRIQPTPGEWDDRACERYRETVDILLSRGITPMVTLHHFTHPLWFIRETPWHKQGAVENFMRFAERILPLFTDVPFWITFNEPFVIFIGGYLFGHIPPGKNNPDKAACAIENILRAHALVYDLIHRLDPDAKVSIAHNMVVFKPLRPVFPPDRILSRKVNEFYNYSLLEAFRTGTLHLRLPFHRPLKIDLPVKDKIDFIGVNYYTRLYMRFSPMEPFLMDVVKQSGPECGASDLGWEIHPEGLSAILRRVAKFAWPIIVTENGIATSSEEKKSRFIADHVREIRNRIQEGIDIRGYFYWSLLDNYEWLQGLDARFGLFRVNYDDYSRRATEAARLYRHLIAASREPACDESLLKDPSPREKRPAAPKDIDVLSRG